MAVSELHALGTTPINPDHPVGTDVRFSPEFELVEGEIAKLSNPVVIDGSEDGSSEGVRFVYQPVDWQTMVKECEGILRSKSKDLRVAAWLTRGLLETEGLEGLAAGLDICAGILEAFGDKAFPLRPAVRASALLQLKDYLRERFEPAQGRQTVATRPSDEASLNKVVDAIGRLDAMWKVKAPDYGVPFGLLDAAISARIDEIRSSKTLSESTEPQASESSDPRPRTDEVRPLNAIELPARASSPATTDYDFAKPGDRYRFFLDQRESAMKYHTHTLQNRPSDPVSYMFVRTVFWSPIEFTEQTPFVPMNGPNDELMRHLDSLRSGRKWLELLKTSEAVFSSYWFWLDLQHLSVEAAKGLGAEFSLVQETLEGELLFLLRRFPFFDRLSSQDNRPVATGETQRWIEGLRTGGSGTGGVSGFGMDLVGAHSAPSERQEYEFDPSLDLSSNLQKSRDWLRSNSGARDTFEIQTKLVAYLLNQGETALAESYCRLLEQQMEYHRLEKWDPNLAVRSLCLTYGCNAELSRVKERREEKQMYLDRCRALIARIAALDPVAASELAKKVKIT